MPTDDLAAFPLRPLSEFEWEDLLVRVELMPRALRVTLDSVDPALPAVQTTLADLAAREAAVAQFLEEAAGTAASPPPHSRERGNPGSFAPEVEPGEDSPPRHSRFRRNDGEEARGRAHAPSSAERDSLTSFLQPLGVQPDRLGLFTRLRQRNFAIVQRRGIQVWEWSATFDARGRATVHQVLSALVAADVRALAEIRAASGTREPAC